MGARGRRGGGELDREPVARPDRPAAQDDGHDSGLADQPALGIAVEHRRHQPGLIIVELLARVAQPGHPDLGFPAELEDRVDRQRQQVEALGQDILAERAGADVEPHLVEFFQ
jgi:hypothetical protein